MLAAAVEVARLVAEDYARKAGFQTEIRVLGRKFGLETGIRIRSAYGGGEWKSGKFDLLFKSLSDGAVGDCRPNLVCSMQMIL